MVIGFIEILKNINTSNYSAIANSHTLKFTTAHSKSFQSAMPSPVVVWQRLPNAVASSASVFTPLLAGDF
jgi:hypothetical protein